MVNEFKSENDHSPLASLEVLCFVGILEAPDNCSMRQPTRRDPSLSHPSAWFLPENSFEIFLNSFVNPNGFSFLLYNHMLGF
ncbi:hypothetical protein VNO77_10071 [Canavalia gladiata]|uniref:Uncharacterized protein n=1 Tax=Canavalia gladiata TaxID=3824 RepID=A0AAN9QWW9_CANGL